MKITINVTISDGCELHYHRIFDNDKLTGAKSYEGIAIQSMLNQTLSSNEVLADSAASAARNFLYNFVKTTSENDTPTNETKNKT